MLSAKCYLLKCQLLNAISSITEQILQTIQASLINMLH